MKIRLQRRGSENSSQFLRSRAHCLAKHLQHTQQPPPAQLRSQTDLPSILLRFDFLTPVCSNEGPPAFSTPFIPAVGVGLSNFEAFNVKLEPALAEACFSPQSWKDASSRQ